jgi:hypothetical protein
MNSTVYVTAILEQYVVPFASFIGDNFIFQHDNARPHSARIVSEYLDEVGIASMQWSARSPDLNPIENVWDMMGRRVRAFQPPPATLVEFGEQIIAIWDNLNQADVLSTGWVDGVKPSFMLEGEILATEPFSLVYFVDIIVTIFLFFLIIENILICL